MSIPFADEPGNCPDPSTTPDPYMGGFCATNFTFGPAVGKFCWDRQPDYSAFRESSFGYGIFEVPFPLYPTTCAVQHSMVVEKLHSIN
jgi:acid phosphatase type 7